MYKSQKICYNKYTLKRMNISKKGDMFYEIDYYYQP